MAHLHQEGLLSWISKQVSRHTLLTEGFLLLYTSMLQEYSRTTFHPKNIAQEFLQRLPLSQQSAAGGPSLLAEAIRYSQTQGQDLLFVSTLCPSYSTDAAGIPTYESLEIGISPNSQKHFDYLIPQLKMLAERGVRATHFFLMADTEVDLLPFLKILDIAPRDFIDRCQLSVNMVIEKAVQVYGAEMYERAQVPPAKRFLDFFGNERWFERYEYFQHRLLKERSQNPHASLARGLERDAHERSILIGKLLGDVGFEDQVRHIARQKAQYMAFASLMRERFESRLVVVNHRTPNFAWMNDKITREPLDPEQLAKGNYHSKLPLIELDISTLPNA